MNTHMQSTPFLACGFLAAGLALAATPSTPPAITNLRSVVISDFATDLQKWEYNGGWEFKGAKGSLTHEPVGGRTGGAARLTGDFSKGGSYVAMKRDLRLDAREIRFQVKAPDSRAVHVRLTDAAKQTFQCRLPCRTPPTGSP